ncbi:hypothetical protein HK103_005824 [Boothiomyces macroporosus]|uniref:C3G9 VBS-like domain-containing protein n=1 Tax=Boothiomyces macroporosus TaxID=261099 RepID=A0AAD5UEU9_9FUNG|nr:hypothetical protein HK103_005824 [Boothiomyces macroporosus]
MTVEEDSRIKEYHAILKNFVDSDVTEVKPVPVALLNRFNQLSLDALLDSSKDVADEIYRRTHDSKTMLHLPVRMDFSAKRNQVRQKLATFQTDRFKEFVVQLMMEIEKRYPETKSRISMLPTRTSTRQSTLRKKTTDRDNTVSEPGRRRRTEETQRTNSIRQRSVYQQNEENSMSALDNLRKEYEQKLSSLETQLTRKDDTIASLKDSVSKMEKDQFQTKNSGAQFDQERQKLQKEIDSLQAKNSKLQRELELCRKELQQEQKIAHEAETLCEKLEAKYNKLYAEKENMSQELLKRQGDNTKTIKEIDLISKELAVCQAEKSAAILARDSLKDDVAKYKAEIEDLKSQIKRVEVDRLNTMPKMTKALDSRVGLLSPNSATSGDTALNYSTNASVFEQHFTKFKAYANDLISSSSKGKKHMTVQLAKPLVLLCREITIECEKKEDDPKVREDDKDNIIDCKNKLSDCLANFIACTKVHASEGSLEAAKKLEIEIIALQNCVSELVDIMRIINSDGKKAAQDLEMSLPELIDYTKQKIDSISSHQKDLFSLIKQNSGNGKQMSDLVNDIYICVDDIIYEAQGTLDTTNELKKAAIEDADHQLDVLTDVRTELYRLTDKVLQNPKDRDIKQQITDSVSDALQFSKDLLTILK